MTLLRVGEVRLVRGLGDCDRLTGPPRGVGERVFVDGEIVVMGNQTMGQGVRLQEKRRRELAERDRRLESWHSRC
jgi:hypothetical protein